MIRSPLTAYRLPITAKLPILAIILCAFFLRVWQLDRVPPGWRDDELIESLVISQKILDGDLAVFYPDASGHEALYHALKAPLMAIFGANELGMRLLAAVLGTVAVPLVYVLGKRLFGCRVGLVAATCLAASFWALMYSRVGIRHVALPVFALAAFYWFWRALGGDWETGRLRDWRLKRIGAAGQGRGRESLSLLVSQSLFRNRNWLFAGIWMGLGFYTYFASRGVPLVVLAFCGYLLVVARPLLRRHWRGIVVMFGVAAVLAIPLVVTLNRQPQLEGRVEEVAVPFVEARAGNFEPLRQHILAGFNMFHSDGDPEWLYNIPGRPVFGLVGALFFWTGVAIALWGVVLNAETQRRRGAEERRSGGDSETERLRDWRSRGDDSSPSPLATLPSPLSPRHSSLFTRHSSLSTRHSPLTTLPSPLAFPLIWWLGGIAPAFLSVPPASLGHTILAQPAVYLLAALPVAALWSAVGKRRPRWGQVVVGLAAVVLVAAVAVRDLPGYFVEWPSRGLVRFLYRADVHDVANYLNTADSPPIDFGITGLLAGPWDRVALEIDLDPETAARPRWYNPERVALLRPSVSFSGYPAVVMPYADWYRPLPEDARLAGGYVLSELRPENQLEVDPLTTVCFDNGLCLLKAEYHLTDGILELLWHVEDELELPPLPLISNPPPPGVYAGPRLHVFAQLQDDAGSLLAGDDGLWIDPVTLQPGDMFLQRHYLVAPENSQPAAVVVGLYDPMDGRRVLTVDGRDHIEMIVER